MNKTRIGWALGAFALVALLALLVTMQRSIDVGANDEVVATLRSLKQIDAEWNVDVLRSKTGLNASYDPVASPLPVLERLAAQLQGRSRQSLGADRAALARMQPLLDDFRKAMEHKTDLIEGFKSQNAILRNSSGFLPTAAADLLEALPAQGLERVRVERTLNALLIDTMGFTQAADTALKLRVEAGVRELQQRVQPLGDAVRVRSDTLAAHVATIVRQQLIGDRLLADLASVPTARALDALAEGQAHEQALQLQRQQRWTQALAAYAVLLLLLLAWAGWRLYRAWQELGRTNAELQRANDELKESQVYMVQTEKMSALGQMVAGIAHEINTPLAYVKGTFELVREQLVPVKELSQRFAEFTAALRRPDRDNQALNLQLRNVEAINRDLIDQGLIEEMGTLLADGSHGIDQMSEIVVNLKNFSRLDRARVSEFSVEEGLESTLLLARNLLKNSVEIRREFGAVPSIQGSPSQINQVFLNIITNAAHAMEGRSDKGVITLRTLHEGDGVRIEIQDNGSGIPKDVLPRIFDPFYTTKEVGKGTGMGLAISYKIVQQHGGRILVDTEEGAGTVFSIVLPLHGARAGAIESEPERLAA